MAALKLIASWISEDEKSHSPRSHWCAFLGVRRKSTLIKTVTWHDEWIWMDSVWHDEYIPLETSKTSETSKVAPANHQQGFPGFAFAHRLERCTKILSSKLNIAMENALRIDDLPCTYGKVVIVPHVNLPEGTVIQYIVGLKGCNCNILQQPQQRLRRRVWMDPMEGCWLNCWDDKSWTVLKSGWPMSSSCSLCH